MRRPYGGRLSELTRARGALCVGIDPHPELLDAWGLPPDAGGLERCARGVVEALGDAVAVFKPQSAFYEAYGSAGIAVLERVLADIAAAGALSLLDVKRGDIGSTMAAYAAAYLTDGSPLAADAITVHPYLGVGSLGGAMDQAVASGRGIYVLALTSNPEGPQIQQARTESGRSVGQSVVDAAAARNAAAELGSIGVVVGATIGRAGVDFAALHGSILVPGLGAQGGRPKDLADVLGSALPWALPAASREILGAGPRPEDLRGAVSRLLEQLSPVFALS